MIDSRRFSRFLDDTACSVYPSSSSSFSPSSISVASVCSIIGPAMPLYRSVPDTNIGYEIVRRIRWIPPSFSTISPPRDIFQIILRENGTRLLNPLCSWFMVDENVYIDICTYKTTIGCTNLNVPWLIAALNKYKKERFERMFSLYWKFVEFLYLPCFYLVFFFSILTSILILCQRVG